MPKKMGRRAQTPPTEHRLESDGTLTSELVFTMKGGRAKAHLPNNVNMGRVLETVKTAMAHKIGGEPTILALNGENEPFWMPISQMRTSTIAASGCEACLSRPPSSGLVNYAFWLAPSKKGRDSKLLAEFDENIRATLEARIQHALADQEEVETPHLIVVTRKFTDGGRGELDVIAISKITAVELGRGCLRRASAPQQATAIEQQPSV